MATPLGVELLAIVTGPLRLLDEKPKPIKPRDVMKAADVGDWVGREIRAFLQDDKPQAQGDEPPMLDYQAINRQVSKLADGIPLEVRTAVCADLPDPMLASQYSLQFDRLHDFLRETLPRRSIVTLTGMQAVEPSELELSAYWRAWEAAKDPRVLLRDMREGILVGDQVEVVKQFYPALYAVMTGAMLAAMAELKAKDDDWEPTTEQEQQIEVLLQISRLSDELAAELQERARRAEQAERAEEAGAGKAEKPIQDKTADSYQTATQRITYR